MNECYLVSKIQDIFEILTHTMMLYGKEDSVQDDAKSDNNIKESVIDEGVEDVLSLKPTLIVKTAGLTASTVSVTARL